LDVIKLKIPILQRKKNPETYLEWKKTMDWILDCNNYSEAKKVKVVVIELTYYALIWWDQNVISRRSGERPVASWEEIKVLMDKMDLEENTYLQGKNSPEMYLEWEKKMDWILDCNNYLEAKKVKVVVIEFTYYALIWWN
jgi:hypoxanthine phosphoribosyltransferase